MTQCDQPRPPEWRCVSQWPRHTPWVASCDHPIPLIDQLCGSGAIQAPLSGWKAAYAIFFIHSTLLPIFILELVLISEKSPKYWFVGNIFCDHASAVVAVIGFGLHAFVNKCKRGMSVQNTSSVSSYIQFFICNQIYEHTDCTYSSIVGCSFCVYNNWLVVLFLYVKHVRYSPRQIYLHEYTVHPLMITIHTFCHYCHLIMTTNFVLSMYIVSNITYYNVHLATSYYHYNGHNNHYMIGTSFQLFSLTFTYFNITCGCVIFDNITLPII